MRGQLTRLVVLWRNSFPHSVKDATVEQAKGNPQLWVVTLEGRAGSLSCKIGKFNYSCMYSGTCVLWTPWDHQKVS